MAKPKKKTKIVEKHFLGDEPFYPEIHGRNDYNLTKALNWYSYIGDLKEGRIWLLQWMKETGYSKQQLADAKSIHDNWMPPTICWLARMANNGTMFSEANLEYLHSKVQEFLSHKKEKVETAVVVDLRKRIDDKNQQVWALTEEQVIDSYMLGKEVSMYDFLVRNEIAQQHAAYIKEKYQAAYDEIHSDDEQIKEAYGKRLKKERDFWQKLMDDLDRYIGNKKSTKVRKPREKKEKPVSKIIEKLNYQKDDPTLKIVSIAPQNVIGASQLWTFNTKSRRLSVFNASGPDGFSIRGTTLTGFNPETSIEKTLRKPEITINEVLKAGKVAIKKIMPELSTKEAPASGRINNTTILLRAIK